MKKSLLIISPFVAFLFAATFAQTKSPVEGVWKISVWIEHGDTNTNPHASLFIFTKNYYSVAHLNKSRAELGPTKDPKNLTDAEKIERFEQWNAFTGISGSYEVKGSTLIMHPIVAKATWQMNGQTPQQLTFKLEGTSTLWIIPTGESATRVGLKMKLTRLE
jgi:hypothetical protein